MTRVVALLRGVNLGKRQMKMAELKAALEGAGYTDVKTILASGNVRFEAPGLDGLKPKIDALLSAAFSFRVEVLIRTIAALEKLIASDPFADVAKDADVARHVLFAEPALDPLPVFKDLPTHIEIARSTPGEICIVAHRLPNGRYTEGMELLSKQLPKSVLVTMRNWNTVMKTVA